MIIDFHSHILPAIDDGSKTIEESLEMLKIIKAQGIDGVVATPHFYADEDFPADFLKRRKIAYDKLAKALPLDDYPKIYLGAEVTYFRGMSQSDSLKDLAIQGTNAIMVEMPMTKWTDSMYDELEQIHIRHGLIPIIAHVDRYLTPLRSFGIPERLVELPVLVQVNASAFLNKRMQKKIIKLLSGDMIHLLGSDAHNLNQRAPNLGSALEVINQLLGSEAVERIASWQNKVIK